jgi:hypothetical protein
MDPAIFWSLAHACTVDKLNSIYYEQGSKRLELMTKKKENQQNNNERKRHKDSKLTNSRIVHTVNDNLIDSSSLESFLILKVSWNLS